MILQETIDIVMMLKRIQGEMVTDTIAEVKSKQ
jgi:hypothetical protein